MPDFTDQLSDDSIETDQILMRRFRGGEENAAADLYLRYARRLQQLATNQTSTQLSLRISSDEIVQSVFRTFFRRVSVGQYDAIERDDLWRLFLVIALNKIRSNAKFHQAQKRDVRKTMFGNLDGIAKKTEASGEDEVAYAVLKMTVEELLADLPEGHADMIRLRIEGHSLSEIAKATGRAQRTTERVLQAFREKLLAIIDS